MPCLSSKVADAPVCWNFQDFPRLFDSIKLKVPRLLDNWASYSGYAKIFLCDLGQIRKVSYLSCYSHHANKSKEFSKIYKVLASLPITYLIIVVIFAFCLETKNA